MKPKNNFLDQLRRKQQEAAGKPPASPADKPIEAMSADELEEARRDVEMDLIRAKSAELTEIHKASVLGESGGTQPASRAQFLPQQRIRHWR